VSRASDPGVRPPKILFVLLFFPVRRGKTMAPWLLLVRSFVRFFLYATPRPDMNETLVPPPPLPAACGWPPLFIHITSDSPLSPLLSPTLSARMANAKYARSMQLRELYRSRNLQNIIDDKCRITIFQWFSTLFDGFPYVPFLTPLHTYSCRNLQARREN
jgi:hypothetical protein